MKKVLAGGLALALVFTAGGCSGGRGGGDPAAHDAVAKDWVELMGEIAGALEKVKDEKSSEAAKPKLDAIKEKMDRLAERAKDLGKLSKSQREALDKKYKADMGAANKRVNAEMQRLNDDGAINLPILSRMIDLLDVAHAVEREWKK
jgi:hypothetical protein